jgi:dihydroxyacetone kinase-like protein
MKKIINDPKNIVNEMAEGLALAYPQYVKQIPLENKGEAILARSKKKTGKVALVSGGGSGHEPAHAGYVGEGMLDAAVCGAVFTSPTPDAVLEALKAIKTDQGVLMVVKNYTGDVMNFEMAADMAKDEGIKTAEVVVNDDVAVMNSSFTTGRRGITGTVFVHKIAGAAAEAGLPLDKVQAVAQKVIANVRSMSLALTPCTVPEAGKPGFNLGEDEIEIGIGIHGEPGVRKGKIQPCDDLVEELLDKIVKDNPLKSGDEVALIVNGMGGTPLMELFLANRKAHQILTKMGVKVHMSNVGNYMTSIEMAGLSLSVLKLDAELAKYLDAKADTPAYRVLG